MDDPPPPARWTLPALAAALAGGALVGWALRARPLTALLIGATVTATVIAITEVIRHRANRDAQIGEQTAAAGGNAMMPRIPYRPAAGYWPVTVTALALAAGGLAGMAGYLAGSDEIGVAAGQNRTTAIIVEPVAVTPQGPRAALGRWAAPDGSLRTGPIPAPASLPAGARHPIWTDEHGALTQPPSSRSAELWDAAATGAIAAVLAAAVALAIRRTLRLRRARHPEDPLDAEWRRIAERWRRRYR